VVPLYQGTIMVILSLIDSNTMRWSCRSNVESISYRYTLFYLFVD